MAACGSGAGISCACAGVCVAYSAGRVCRFSAGAGHGAGAPALGCHVGLGRQPAHARAFAFSGAVSFWWLGGRCGVCRRPGAAGARFAMGAGIRPGTVGGAVCFSGQPATRLSGVWMHAGGLFGGHGGGAAPRPGRQRMALGVGPHADGDHRCGCCAVYFVVLCATAQSCGVDCAKPQRFGRCAASHGRPIAPAVCRASGGRWPPAEPSGASGRTAGAVPGRLTHGTQYLQSHALAATLRHGAGVPAGAGTGPCRRRPAGIG